MAELKKTETDVRFTFEFTEQEVRDTVAIMGPNPATGKSFDVFTAMTAALRAIDDKPVTEDW